MAASRFSVRSMSRKRGHRAGLYESSLTPFWDPALTELYSTCALPTATDWECPYPNAAMDLEGSWFYRSRVALLQEASSSEPGTNWRSLLDVSSTTVVSAPLLEPPRKRSSAGKLRSDKQKARMETRTRKIRMRLSKEQEIIMTNWIRAARYTYNQCVACIAGGFPKCQKALRDRFVTQGEYSEEIIFAWKGELEELEQMEFLDEAKLKRLRFLRSRLGGLSYRQEMRQLHGYQVGDFYRDNVKLLSCCPADIRHEAMRDILKADDSNVARQERGERAAHTWRHKFRNKKDPSSWTITIGKRHIKNIRTVPRPCTRKVSSCSIASSSFTKLV